MESEFHYFRASFRRLRKIQHESQKTDSFAKADYQALSLNDLLDEP